MMRVLTVTLNPCVDRTLWVEEFGGEPVSIDTMSGGKGVNVARVLHALGVDCVAIAPVAGAQGKEFSDLTAREQVPLHAVPVSGETRRIDTYVRLSDYAQRVVRQEGPCLSALEIQAIREAVLDRLDQFAVLAICGSASCPEGAVLIPELISEAKRRGLRTLLDANQEALIQGAAALPDVLKLNEAELAQLLGPSSDPLHGEAARLIENGVGRILLTLGERGCVQFLGEQAAFCPAPQVKCVNAVGSGDCFTAAWLFAQLRGYSDDGALALGCAAGAANAACFPPACIGRADMERVLGFSLA